MNSASVIKDLSVICSTHYTDKQFFGQEIMMLTISVKKLTRVFLGRLELI
jgi:hypothetical protein